MIQMKSGVYGAKDGMKRASDGPFSLSKAEETRLVNRGVAKYVEAPAVEEPELSDLPDGVTGIPAYSEDMTAKELREIGEMCGLSFPAVGMKKADMVAALDEYIAAHTVDGVTVDENGEITVDEGGEDQTDAPPAFDPAGAVQA